MFNKFITLTFFIMVVSCNERKELATNMSSQIVELNVSKIPNDTIFLDNTSLKLLNGVYYFHGKPFSGFIKEFYETNTIKSIGSYYNGRQYGLTQTFYLDGSKKTVRNYNDGKAYGKHFGYWKNGNKEFEFTYYYDKREGLQMQWYQSGQAYFELNFTDDKENGMQKAWRENGKLYINYEVKNGERYGLQKSGLCYTLKNQQMK